MADAAALIRATRGLTLAGLHCHFPGTDPDLFGVRMDNLVNAARIAFPTSPPAFLGVGGGFHGGVPRPDPAQGVGHYGQALLPTVDREFGCGGPRLVLEPGTALVAAAVTFVTRIRVVKRQPDRPTAVVSGSLLDISPNTRRTNLPVHLITPSPDTARAGREAGRFDISGSTPMPDEYLSFEVPGNPRSGDFVCFHHVGAYSWAMAPTWLRDRAPLVTLSPGQSSPRAR